MNFIYSNFLEALAEDFKRAKKEILIITPYVKKEAANQLINQGRSKSKPTLNLITLPPGIEYIDGATDPAAIADLQDAGFTIYLLEDLHAKIYMFDRKIVYAGSANLTNRGLGIRGELKGLKDNKELLVRMEISSTESKKIREQFLDSATEVSVPKEWANNIETLLGQLDYVPISLKYKEALDKIRNSLSIESKQVKFLKELVKEGKIKSFDHINSGMNKHAFKINEQHVVKVFRSKQGVHDNHTYSYQITAPTAALIRQRKIKALLFILEEDPDHFVSVPSGFLINEVLKKEYQTQKNKDWQIKIKRMTDQSLWLSPAGRNESYRIPLTKYEDSFIIKIK
ncbi:hypothetical protein HQN89_21910 [Paenibacillus frigoriresistens]|uniref:phospholipase D-like domain-containing protein n=1 Tax=Paenibacillus alginolyticus TaxID=59839 RepID=UPI0015651ACD|nr:phospholipase D-like domain-containing protein [Paenibacillus frigoriresistens]NRF93603.1 hypothetical protein [Paenibacillus frigoriresistens]